MFEMVKETVRRKSMSRRCNARKEDGCGECGSERTNERIRSKRRNGKNEGVRAYVKMEGTDESYEGMPNKPRKERRNEKKRKKKKTHHQPSSQAPPQPPLPSPHQVLPPPHRTKPLPTPTTSSMLYPEMLILLLVVAFVLCEEPEPELASFPFPAPVRAVGVGSLPAPPTIHTAARVRKGLTPTAAAPSSAEGNCGNASEPTMRAPHPFSVSPHAGYGWCEHGESGAAAAVRCRAGGGSGFVTAVAPVADEEAETEEEEEEDEGAENGADSAGKGKWGGHIQRLQLQLHQPRRRLHQHKGRHSTEGPAAAAASGRAAAAWARSMAVTLCAAINGMSIELEELGRKKATEYLRMKQRGSQSRLLVGWPVAMKRTMAWTIVSAVSVMGDKEPIQDAGSDSSTTPSQTKRGMFIFSPSMSPIIASPLQLFLANKLQRVGNKKMQRQLLNQLVNILQVAVVVFVPALKEDEPKEPIERQQLLSPRSERKMSQIWTWSKPAMEDAAHVLLGFSKYHCGMRDLQMQQRIGSMLMG
ncbi:hypothetical protein B0H11DRAFT_1914616 [Mycena galericulata]|nr:hypothetical protein B0H11DRAFT_1914616 [Mycena galericulata]